MESNFRDVADYMHDTVLVDKDDYGQFVSRSRTLEALMEHIFAVAKLNYDGTKLQVEVNSDLLRALFPTRYGVTFRNLKELQKEKDDEQF